MGGQSDAKLDLRGVLDTELQPQESRANICSVTCFKLLPRGHLWTFQERFLLVSSSQEL